MILTFRMTFTMYAMRTLKRGLSGKTLIEDFSDIYFSEELDIEVNKRFYLFFA